MGDLKGIEGFFWWIIHVGTQRLMVSFAKNVCILLESVEIVVMELRFCKVVCYIDIFFKQIVWGEEKQKRVRTRVGITWNSFVRKTIEIWWGPCYGDSIFIFPLNFLSMDKSSIPASVSSLKGGNGRNAP